MFCRVFDLVFFFFEYVQIRFPGKRRGRDGGNWLEPILFGIVNVLHRPRCPITYIFHVWNHACLLLQKGEGRHKGSNPDCSRTVCSPHEEKKERRSSVGALGKECSSISTQAREGSCFPHAGVPFPPLLLLSIVVLLWNCRPLGPKSAFTEHTPQITPLTSPTTLNIAFPNLLSLRLAKNNNKKKDLGERKMAAYLFICFLLHL